MTTTRKNALEGKVCHRDQIVPEGGMAIAVKTDEVAKAGLSVLTIQGTAL